MKKEMRLRGKTRVLTVAMAIIMVAMSVMSSAQTAFAAEDVNSPSVTAKGAIVYCENTGETIYAKNENSQIYPYSITKLMTAILIMQNKKMDDIVTVSPKAASQIEVNIDMVAGEKFTVKDLLYAMLLESGNDAAYALGESVTGDLSDFVKMMNTTASNIGCKNTHFANPNGLQDKGNYSSPYDIMLITRVALSDPTIKAIAGTKKYTMAATNKSKKRVVKNHLSEIITLGNGIYGGKTGFWDTTDCSVTVGYEKNGLNLYIVLLGDTEIQRPYDLKNLIKYATEAIPGIKVIKAGKNVGKVRIKHGAKTRLDAYTKDIGYAYLPKEGSKSLISTKKVINDNVEAPVKAGTVVGSYEIYVADELVNKVPLVIKEDVEEGWFPSYIGISNDTTVIILIVLALLLLLAFAFLSVRRKNRKKIKRQRMQKAVAIARKQMEEEKEHAERGWRF